MMGNRMRFDSEMLGPTPEEDAARSSLFRLARGNVGGVDSPMSGYGGEPGTRRWGGSAAPFALDNDMISRSFDPGGGDGNFSEAIRRSQVNGQGMGSSGGNAGNFSQILDMLMQNRQNMGGMQGNGIGRGRSQRMGIHPLLARLLLQQRAGLGGLSRMQGRGNQTTLPGNNGY